jgi:hypothetical protein
VGSLMNRGASRFGFKWPRAFHTFAPENGGLTGPVAELIALQFPHGFLGLSGLTG